MSTTWDAAAAGMDQRIDAILGDTLTYAIAGGAPATIKGFVFNENLGTADNYLDGVLGTQLRVKVSKLDVPNPTVADRLTSPRLVGVYCPLGKLPEDEGRYWLFDVELVDQSVYDPSLDHTDPRNSQFL